MTANALTNLLARATTTPRMHTSALGPQRTPPGSLFHCRPARLIPLRAALSTYANALKLRLSSTQGTVAIQSP